LFPLLQSKLLVPDLVIGRLKVPAILPVPIKSHLDIRMDLISEDSLDFYLLLGELRQVDALLGREQKHVERKRVRRCRRGGLRSFVRFRLGVLLGVLVGPKRDGVGER
jgi:hypothetical protein